MVDKEKLLLLATIYMLVPGAMSDALADTSDTSKPKAKKAQAIHKVATAKTSESASKKKTSRRK